MFDTLLAASPTPATRLLAVLWNTTKRPSALTDDAQESSPLLSFGESEPLLPSPWVPGIVWPVVIAPPLSAPPLMPETSCSVWVWVLKRYTSAFPEVLPVSKVYVPLLLPPKTAVIWAAVLSKVMSWAPPERLA